MVLMLSGRAFQSTWVATLKDLSANVLHFVDGHSSKFVICADLSPSCLVCLKLIMSCRYFGPVLFMYLCVSVSILNLILCFIGSQ